MRKRVKNQDSDDVGDMVDEVENTASDEKDQPKKAFLCLIRKRMA